MNKQELIKKLEERRTMTRNFQGYVVWWKDVKEIFEQLGEPQPVKVPQFVADWIRKCKMFKHFAVSLSFALQPIVWEENGLSHECIEWLMDANNQELFARAWLDGYEVEKEKRCKCIKIPEEIRPFDIGYRIVNKYGQALALRNGASIFDLPFLAEKAIEKEFGKNDPDFDIGKHSVEEIAIVILSKFHSYFEEVIHD
ncbi:phage protein [Streptococcus pneumoniae]|nr:putative prophage protein [Streptococcus pneumoniae]VMQ56668.1 phage protein [Streptococcus pneumoniae]